MMYNNYDNDNENKEYIKKAIVIIVVLVIVFFIVRACNNSLTNKIREDIKQETTIIAIEQEKEKIDLNKPFSYYHITSDYELHSLIKDISKYLRPKKLQNYVDYEMYSSRDNWNVDETLNEFLINWLPRQTYRNLLRRLLYNQVNYDEAPLTEHFKEKFKENECILYDYGIEINNQAFHWVEYDYDKKYFAVETNKGSEINEIIDRLYIYSQDYHYFNFILDEEGYLDDIVFDHIRHITDENGEEIPVIDQYKMNEEKNVRWIIRWLCTPRKYGNRTAPTDDWYHAYDKDLNYALTDNFREFSSALQPNGILQYEDFVSFKIESIDVEKMIAKVKVELDDKYEYYDITWTLVDGYKMDTVKATLNHEETK